MADKFTLPLIKRLSELETAIKAGKFKIEFENEKKDDDEAKTTPKPNVGEKKDDDDKEPKTLILNFNSVSFSPNEKLFPVEKQSNVFEMIGANKKIRPDYVFEESSSEKTSLKTLNDCYLHCLNSNTDHVVCHSFAFCLEPAKSLAKCQLSSLYFEESMQSFDSPNALADDKSTTPPTGGQDVDYSKWLEEASGCKTYNLMFKNYFRPVDDRMMVEHYSFLTLNDYTEEECLEQCHFHSKSNETAQDDSMCRLVEYCVQEASIDENGMEKKSTCMMSNEELKVLPPKDLGLKKDCQLYDCK